MRAETGRRSLGARGDPEFGSWLAYDSIPVIDDEGTSSSTTTWHRADPCAGRYGCEHRALCRRAARRTGSLHSDILWVASPRRAPRAAAVVGALGNAANDNWEFGPGYFSEAAHASLRGAGWTSGDPRKEPRHLAHRNLA